MTRTTRETVTFTRPFAIASFDGVLPAGTYVVETDDEALPGLSFVAYRRKQTRLDLPARGGIRQTLTIDPVDFAGALERDREGQAQRAGSDITEEEVTGLPPQDPRPRSGR